MQDLSVSRRLIERIHVKMIGMTPADRDHENAPPPPYAFQARGRAGDVGAAAR